MEKTVSFKQFQEAFGKILENLKRHREYLNDLDSPIGDSDHGESVCRAFEKVKETVDALPQGVRDIGSLLEAVGKAIIFSGGAAMGPLYGTGFLDAGRAVSGKEMLTLEDFVRLFEAFTQGVQHRGQVQPGEKTMYDTLYPTLLALKKAKEEGKSLKEALKLGIAAAKAGMESTKDMLSKRGRSSRLGERSIGHIDPGAASSYFIIEAWFGSFANE